MTEDLVARIVSDTSIVGLAIVALFLFRSRINAMLDKKAEEAEAVRSLCGVMERAVVDWREHALKLEAIATEGVGYIRQYQGDGDGDHPQH